MRKIIALAGLLLVCVFATRAQRYYSPEFWIGAKGGASFSSMSFTPSVEQNWITGATGGIVLRYTEEKIFGLIGEVNITQRGWVENVKEAKHLHYSRQLTYITVPIMTHIYFGRKVKGFVNLGPSISYLLGSRIRSNFNYRNPGAVEDFPKKNRPVEEMSMKISNSFDYGIVGGLGMEVRVAKRHALVLEGRYYFGIGNIFPSAKRDLFAASRAMSIEASVAYLFKVK